jgi:diphosphomevalonate decarboxylase
MSESLRVSKAFAPVNIAWIKYMGKDFKGKPTNASLSLTLQSFGTTTEMKVIDDVSAGGFVWSDEGYVPPASGIQKVENFLQNTPLWAKLLQSFGFEPCFPESKVLIHTQNNVPTGTGIATSASAFAALTLAWSGLLAGSRKQEWIALFDSQDFQFRKALASVAASGSGSACRSLDGPWVEWTTDDGIYQINGGKTRWVDFILVVESGHKSVPSSEAHARVRTSPLFADRSERAENRLKQLRTLLLRTPASIGEIRKLVLDEALDMHELFHTSVPPFAYMNSISHEIVSCFKNDGCSLPSPNSVVTLDAGANVHVFVPAKEQAIWKKWLTQRFGNLKILQDQSTERNGARYEIV